MADLPAAWNAKYKEYLGVDVPDDTHGCLQDITGQWRYGYFPAMRWAVLQRTGGG